MKKNKKKKTTEKNNKYLKILLISFILIFLIGLIVYAKNFRDFSSMTLRTNNKDYYNINDLVINDIKYLDNEAKVDKAFGKANKVETKVIGSYKYKIKKYKGLTLTLKENYEDFVLVKVEVTSKDYKLGRNLGVGKKISKVLRSYRVNKSKSPYMYGNYKRDVLGDKSVKKEIYYGYRDKTFVEYVVRDAYTSEDSSIMLSKIVYEYKYGKVTKVTWSYDVQ